MKPKKIDPSIASAASAFGRLGGSATSKKKARASRRNAKLATAARWPKKKAS